VRLLGARSGRAFAVELEPGGLGLREAARYSDAVLLLHASLR